VRVLSHTVRRATEAELPEILEVIVRAFDDNVATAWMVRADARRVEGLRLYFRNLLHKLVWPHGEVWTNDGDVKGAALWVPPGKWELGFFTQLGLVPPMLRAFGWSRARRSLDCINQAQRHHPKHEHFYLSVLGVDPSFQGRGLGKALMQPVLERCDAQSIPAFLETESEKNVRLYKGRGFELTLTEPMPGGGPLIYYMSRPPRRP
jgi:ribosomal protein S18 acetylase RimI-like enzyme